MLLGVDIVDVSSQRPPLQAFLLSNSFTALIFQLRITIICSHTNLLEKSKKQTTDKSNLNDPITEFYA